MRKREKRACAIKQSAIDQNSNMTHNFIMTIQLQHLKAWFDFYSLNVLLCVFCRSRMGHKNYYYDCIYFFLFMLQKKNSFCKCTKKFEQNLLKLKMNQLGILHELIHSWNQSISSYFLILAIALSAEESILIENWKLKNLPTLC